MHKSSATNATTNSAHFHFFLSQEQVVCVISQLPKRLYWTAALKTKNYHFLTDREEKTRDERC